MRFARSDCAKRTFEREGKNPVIDAKDATEVMLRLSSGKRLLQLLPIILILAALGGLTGCVGISMCVGRLAELGLGWVSWLVGAFCLLFALCFLDGALYSVTDACSQVAATSVGVEERRFGWYFSGLWPFRDQISSVFRSDGSRTISARADRC